MHQLIAQTLPLTSTREITQKADVSISTHKPRLMKWGVVAAISLPKSEFIETRFSVHDSYRRDPYH